MERKNLKKTKRTLLLCIALTLGFVFVLSQVSSASPVIKWNASLWGGPREWTYPFERWAKDMERLTNGDWQIKLHYAEALSSPKENLDGLKAGMFEAMHYCAVYHPGKMPLHTVLELPFIAPPRSLHISQMTAALWEHPALLKELERWNAVPLLPGNVLINNMMSNKPVRNVNDLKGLRLRIGGELGKVAEMFGAVPTMVTAPEFYEAMERRTIDAGVFPWPDAFGNFKVHEVSKYAIVGLDLGTSNCAYLCSKKAWNALPENFKKIHMEWYKKAGHEWDKDAEACIKKWIPVFKEKLEFIEFPSEERAKMVEKAQIVWDAWVKKYEERGLPAKEILTYTLSQRKKITGR